ncbi:MAG TPA: hypothetical protein VF787_26585 [Thermoanaerobaculia bacterium]
MSSVFLSASHVNETAPDVVDIVVTVDPNTRNTRLSFGAARWRIDGRAGFGGVTVAANDLAAPLVDNLDAAIIPVTATDGRIDAPSFRWKDGAGDCSLVVTWPDTSDVDVRECAFTYDSATALAYPVIESSTDHGASWNPVTPNELRHRTVTGTLKEVLLVWDSLLGGPRSFRFSRPAGSSVASVFHDVLFRAYGDPVGGCEYVIYDVRSGSRSEYARRSSAPTDADPIDVSAIATVTDQGVVDVQVEVIAIRDARAESSGVLVKLSRASSFSAWPDLAMASVGGHLLVTPATKLTAALTAVATTITVERASFGNGHRVFLQANVNGVLQSEHLAITSIATGTGPYTYSVTRNINGGGAFAWGVNTSVTSLAATGGAFIDVYSGTGLKSASEIGPTIVGNVRVSGTFNDWSPRWAIGNLNGLFGYGTDTFGAAFGVPSAAWLKVDPVNGIRIGHNATTKIAIDAAGNASFSGAITAASGTIGGWTIGATLLSSGNLKLESSGTAYIGVASGTPSYGAVATKFYADASGKWSLSNKVLWDGSDISIESGNVTINPSGGVTIKENGGLASGALNFANSGGAVVSSIAGSSGNILFSVSGGSIDLGGTAATFNSVYIDCVGGISTANTLPPGAGYFNSQNGYKYQGTQVVGAQGAAVANATGAGDVVARLNDLLARVRTHGLIAT